MEDITIFAKKLFVMEMGKCGNPKLHQLQWIRNKIKANSPSRKTVLLIRRTKRRPSSDFELIKQIVQTWSYQQNLQFVVFSDKNLPSIEEQLDMFRNVHTIITPHGAGLVNMLASPPGTNIVEFVNVDYPNMNFMIQAYDLGFEYFSVPQNYNEKHKIIPTISADKDVLDQISTVVYNKFLATVYMFSLIELHIWLHDKQKAKIILSDNEFKWCHSKDFHIISTKKYSDWGHINGQTDFVKYMSNKTKTIPDVVYFNGGLHYLHLLPFRKWGIINSWNIARGFQLWLNAETIVNKFVNETRESIPLNAKIIYMTSHSICDKKYTGDYAKAVSEIKNDPELFAQPCVDFLTSQFKIQKTKSVQYCMNATFNRRGIKLLNERIINSLDKNVYILDAFNLSDNQCNHTKIGDGRHYDAYIVQKELQNLVNNCLVFSLQFPKKKTMLFGSQILLLFVLTLIFQVYLRSVIVIK